jgi:hypothetical protein
VTLDEISRQIQEVPYVAVMLYETSVRPIQMVSLLYLIPAKDDRKQILISSHSF